MNIFNDFPVGLFVMSTVIVLLLVFLLGKFAWKPILAAIDQREQGIRDSLDAAEKASKQAQNQHAENERLLKEAREEREALLKDARAIKDKIIADAKTEAGKETEKMITIAKTSIEHEKQVALSEVKKQVADLSLSIAQKVVVKELSSSDDQLKLVESLLDEVSL